MESHAALIIALVSFLANTQASEDISKIQPTENGSEILVPIIGLEHRSAPKDTHDECFWLADDYGFFMCCCTSNEKPEIRAYEKNPPKILTFPTVDELIKWLRKLPNGAHVDAIHHCTRAWGGIPERKLNQLQDVYKEENLTVEECGFCYCECRHMLFKSLARCQG